MGFVYSYCINGIQLLSVELAFQFKVPYIFTGGQVSQHLMSSQACSFKESDQDFYRHQDKPKELMITLY